MNEDEINDSLVTIVDPVKALADAMLPYLVARIETIAVKHIETELEELVREPMDNASELIVEDVIDTLESDGRFDIRDEVEDICDDVVNDKINDAVSDVIDDHIDYYDIVQNLDYHAIANYVEDYIERDSDDIQGAMQDVIESGCGAVDSICYMVLQRAKDAGDYACGEVDGPIVLKFSEYERLIKVIEFVESTFVIPAKLTPVEEVSNMIWNDVKNILPIEQEVMKRKQDLSAFLRKMKKPELVAWAEENGYDIQGMTIAEILQKVGV